MKIGILGLGKMERSASARVRLLDRRGGGE